MFESFRTLGERDLKKLAKTLFDLLQNPDQPIDLDGCRAMVSRLHRNPTGGKHRQATSPVSPLHMGFTPGRQAGKLWFLPEEMATSPRLIFGETGAGRGETLVTLCKPFIDAGQGCVYVDGNGDTGVSSRIMGLAIEAGREKDVLVLNLCQGGRQYDRREGPWWKQGFAGQPLAASLVEPEASHWTRYRSHTFNPFERAGADEICSWLLPWLMETAKDDPRVVDLRQTISGVEHEFETLLRAILGVLVNGRDKGLWPLDGRVVHEALGGGHNWPLYELARDPRLDEAERQALMAFGDTRIPKVRAVVSTASAVFPHALDFMCHHPLWWAEMDDNTWGASDIDWMDAMVRQKIVVVLAPALSNSTDEVRAMMRPILGSLRAAMDTQLSTMEALPEALWVFDQAGYYLTDDLARVNRAAGHGVTVAWGASNYPALKATSETAAQTVAGDCRVKVFMKMHVGAGADLAGKTGLPEDGTGPTEAGRLARTLSAFEPGEAHVMVGGVVARVRMAYHRPPKPPVFEPPSLPPRWTRVLRIDKGWA